MKETQDHRKLFEQFIKAECGSCVDTTRAFPECHSSQINTTQASVHHVTYIQIECSCLSIKSRDVGLSRDEDCDSTGTLVVMGARYVAIHVESSQLIFILIIN